MYLLRVVIGLSDRLPLLSLVGVITLVLVLRQSIENCSNCYLTLVTIMVKSRRTLRSVVKPTETQKIQAELNREPLITNYPQAIRTGSKSYNLMREKICNPFQPLSTVGKDATGGKRLQLLPSAGKQAPAISRLVCDCFSLVEMQYVCSDWFDLLICLTC